MATTSLYGDDVDERFSGHASLDDDMDAHSVHMQDVEEDDEDMEADDSDESEADDSEEDKPIDGMLKLERITWPAHAHHLQPDDPLVPEKDTFRFDKGIADARRLLTEKNAQMSALENELDLIEASLKNPAEKRPHTATTINPRPLKTVRSSKNLSLAEPSNDPLYANQPTETWIGNNMFDFVVDDNSIPYLGHDDAASSMSDEMQENFSTAISDSSILDSADLNQRFGSTHGLDDSQRMLPPPLPSGAQPFGELSSIRPSTASKHTRAPPLGLAERLESPQTQYTSVSTAVLSAGSTARKRNRLRKMARKSMTVDPMTVRYVVRGKGEDWQTPMGLDADIKAEMDAHVAKIRPNRKFLRICNRKGGNGDSQPHDAACMGCRVVEHQAGGCNIVEELFIACPECVHTSKQPCASLIKVGAEVVIAFVPLPEAVRGESTWNEKGYWIRLGPITSMIKVEKP
ncbi:hypothetical protein ACN47E_004435 [Coniothyrium glycines]